MTDVRRPDARELWDTMSRTRFPFALMDPTTHRFVDGNAPYAALFELTVEELKGSSVTSLYPPEFAESIEALNVAFARGTLQLVRGHVSLPRPNGATIELDGWSRRIEGISEHPLVITSAVEADSETLPDDRYWVAQAPHVFGLTDGWSGSVHDANPERRADQLEQHLWRIGVEVRAAGLMPGAGEAVPLGPIKEFGELTTRQREVVVRLAAGERVAEIAREMYLSPSTVRNHLTAVFRIFGVHSQVELIRILKNVSERQP